MNDNENDSTIGHENDSDRVSKLVVYSDDKDSIGQNRIAKIVINSGGKVVKVVRNDKKTNNDEAKHNDGPKNNDEEQKNNDKDKDIVDKWMNTHDRA